MREYGIVSFILRVSLHRIHEHVMGLLGGPLPVSTFSGPWATRNSLNWQLRPVVVSLLLLLFSVIMEEEKKLKHLKNSEVLGLVTIYFLSLPQIGHI